MGRLIDMTGKKCGRLTVINRIGTGHKGNVMWLCQCECGRMVKIRSDNLRSGHTSSCGRCAKYELLDSDTVKCSVHSGEFIFDKADLPKVRAHGWRINDQGYVVMTDKNHQSLRLHRFLMGSVPAQMDIDHINGCRNDNRRSNLRLATRSQNNQNRRIRQDKKIPFKGVCFHKGAGKYVAYITVNKNSIHLGCFYTAKEAALAYDNAASFYFGEFAKLNFPRKEEDENANTKILEMAV